MNEGALSAAEVEALLAGFESGDRARALPQPNSDLQAALDARLAGWLPQARLIPATHFGIDVAACRRLMLDADRSVWCERALAASLVDFVYGGDGAVESSPHRAWSVSERRMASRVLELARGALHDVDGIALHESCAFDLRVGRGGGRIAYFVASEVPGHAPSLEFTGVLGYVRLSETSAAELGAGDLIAFEPLAQVLLVGDTRAYACRCGSYDNYYAVCIESPLHHLPEPPAADNGELILAIELGRVVLASDDRQAETPGTTLVLDRRLDAPLRAMHRGACFAHVEVVELAGALALHVLERT